MNAELHEMTYDELVETVLDLSRRLDNEKRVSRVFHAEARDWQRRCRRMETGRAGLIEEANAAVRRRWR